MRKLLLIFASLTLATPAANAETWYLMAAGYKVRCQGGCGVGLASWSIPMNSITECEEAGKKFKFNQWGMEDAKGKMWGVLHARDYVCVKGK